MESITITVRNIPKDLWINLRKLAIDKNVPVADVLTEAIREKIERESGT